MMFSHLKIVCSVLGKAPRFLGALLLAQHRLANARRKAVDAFYRTMVAGGVPEPLARRLREEYPQMPIWDLGSSWW